MTTSAQVYYRKWRPAAFSDLAGQEHTAAALRQAVIQGRVSHSYLFCGTRGSGKTTTARILARAVNCLAPENGDPCNRCDPCVAINEGRNMDIIELDAASNRGVEEIREIRDKVHFQPAQSKRKIYIIDEAHMLTREASNAFLKTLEEPPAHVIFILCTTEADRLLPTILSRCQRYDFRRLPGQTIYDRLAHITDQEAVAIQPDALRLVARSAGGSMRDALNILEQLAVSADREITLRDVEESLGLARSDSYLTLAQQLLAGDTPGALAAINQAVWEGAEPRQLHRHTLDLLRSILLLSWRAADTLDLPDDTLTALETAARQADAYRILRAVRIWGEAGPGPRTEFGEHTITEDELWEKHGGRQPEGKVVVKDRIADIMFQMMLLRPAEFDVIATSNLNGDYLSDAVAAEVGGVGIAPGANMADHVAVFEATHGTAPKYANQDKVNPGSLLFSGVMMFDYIGWPEVGRTITAAYEKTVARKVVTYDFARQTEGATEVSTSGFASAIIDSM